MPDISAKLNLLPNEPELKDVLELFRKDVYMNLNCHAIAKIQMFDSVQQTVVASMNYKRSFIKPNLAGVYQNFLVDYPLLVDMPIICMSGGNGALTFPIKPGDDCVVLFNDRDIDNWFGGSSSSGANTPRMHAFTDGMALIGIRSLNNVLVDYAGDAIELRTKDGLTKVSIKEDGSKVSIQVGPEMLVEVDETGKLKILNIAGQDLITTLINLFTNSTVLGIPLVPSAPDFVVLNTFKP